MKRIFPPHGGFFNPLCVASDGNNWFYPHVDLAKTLLFFLQLGSTTNSPVATLYLLKSKNDNLKDIFIRGEYDNRHEAWNIIDSIPTFNGCVGFQSCTANCNPKIVHTAISAIEFKNKYNMNYEETIKTLIENLNLQFTLSKRQLDRLWLTFRCLRPYAKEHINLILF